jgi:hypothetical protein
MEGTAEVLEERAVFLEGGIVAGEAVGRPNVNAVELPTRRIAMRAARRITACPGIPAMPTTTSLGFPGSTMPWLPR